MDARSRWSGSEGLAPRSPRAARADTEIFLREDARARPLAWFGPELRRMLGIDGFQHPFSADRERFRRRRRGNTLEA